MLPYWHFRQWRLGSFSISPQLFLAGAAILIVHFLLLRRARKLGLDAHTAAMMSLVMVMVGWIGAYWFRGFYFADDVKRDWRFLLQLQVGAASFGGLAFGLAAGSVYVAARRLPRGSVTRYVDALSQVFPAGWMVGRFGCVLAHDHPGRATSSLFAVRYPSGPRFDLAVIEVMFLALVMLPLFHWWDRRPRPPGFWLGAFLAIYGAFRLWLDTLHVDPPRYGPLSVDQWAYGAVLLLGLSRLASLRRGVAVE